jgi:hypothetical protein
VQREQQPKKQALHFRSRVYRRESSCVLPKINSERVQDIWAQTFRPCQSFSFRVLLCGASQCGTGLQQRRQALYFCFCEKLLRSSFVNDYRRQSTNCGVFVGLEVFVLECPRGRRLVSPRGRLVCTREGDSPRWHERLISSQPNRSGCSRPPHLRKSYEACTRSQKARSIDGFSAWMFERNPEAQGILLRDQPEQHL